jgi:hypothetical protein
VILIAWRCTSVTLVVILFKLAMAQVCVLCILVILLLIMLPVHLHCTIFFMFLQFLSTFSLSINFLVIMTSFLNIILGLFFVKDRKSKKVLLGGQCESGLYPHQAIRCHHPCACPAEPIYKPCPMACSSWASFFLDSSIYSAPQ